LPSDKWEIYYLLPCAFVDTLTGKVRPRSLIPHEDPTPGIDDHLPVSSNALDSIAADCSKNWKAASSDEKKRMWSIFDETGIFVSTCHHGFILWYADMVQSGELYVIILMRLSDARLIVT
jgi:hypothetical protein